MNAGLSGVVRFCFLDEALLLLLILALGLSTGAARAKSPEDPLESLVLQALATHPTVAAARARTRLAEAGLATLQAQAKPTLGVRANALENRNDLSDDGGTVSSSASLALRAGWEGDPFGRRTPHQEAARLDLTQARLREAAAMLEVRHDVQRDWAALQAAQADTRATELLLSQQRDREARYREGVGHGLRAPALLLEVRQQRLQAEVEVQRTQATAERARQRLQQSMGLPEGVPWTLKVAAEPPIALLQPPPDGLSSAVLKQRPDLQAAWLAVQAAAAREQGAARMGWPSLSLTASGGRVASELGQLLRGGVLGLALGALVDWPLWDGGRQEAAQARASAEAELAMAQYRAQWLQALQESAGAITQAASQQQQRLSELQALDLVRQELSQVQARHRRGLVSSLALIEQQQRVTQAERKRLAADWAAVGAHVSLKRALGGDWATDAGSPVAALVPATTTGSVQGPVSP